MARSMSSSTTTAGDGVRYEYQIEGEVTDVSRQRIANRASITVHPAAVYVGVKLPYFVDQPSGASASLVALTPDGAPRPRHGHHRHVEARAVDQHAPLGRQRLLYVGHGGERDRRRHVDREVGTRARNAGRSRSRKAATSNSARKRKTRTGVWPSPRPSFYALGPGYTAWSRYDHNRIDLVPERKTYKPGDTARIMIKSPWEKATALVTTEREGIRTHHRFALESSQQAITVPITEADIPEHLRVRPARQRPDERRHARRWQRSRQAVVPPWLRAARRRRREQAPRRDRQGRQRRIPSGQQGACHGHGERPRRTALVRAKSPSGPSTTACCR